MSEMSEIDQVHLRAVMLFMSEIIIIFNIHRLKSPKSQLSKTFRIENRFNIKEVMSKNISDNNSAQMLLMSHVGDIRDVKYLNKRSKATLYKAMLLMSETSEIFELHCVS